MPPSLLPLLPYGGGGVDGQVDISGDASRTINFGVAADGWN
jgi:hypothetical protein